MRCHVSMAMEGHKVISFHHKTDLRIPTATVTDNDNVLLPLGEDKHPLAMTSRCPENIHSAHFKVILDFDSLVDATY